MYPLSDLFGSGHLSTPILILENTLWEILTKV